MIHATAGRHVSNDDIAAYERTARALGWSVERHEGGLVATRVGREPVCFGSQPGTGGAPVPPLTGDLAALERSARVQGFAIHHHVGGFVAERGGRSVAFGAPAPQSASALVHRVGDKSTLEARAEMARVLGYAIEWSDDGRSFLRRRAGEPDVRESL